MQVWGRRGEDYSHAEVLAALKEVGVLTEALETTVLKDKAKTKASRQKKKRRTMDGKPKCSLQAASKKPKTAREV